MICNPLKPAAIPERRPPRRGRPKGRLLLRFRRDKTGAAALEFAMVAAPFLAIVVCIVEVSVDFLLFSQIDYAVHKAAQEIRTGSVQTRELTAEQFKTDVLCPKLNILSCSAVRINVVVIKKFQEWLYWSTTNINPATAKWCPGGAAETVLVPVAYPVPLQSMIWAGNKSAANGVRYYLAAAAFRTDPYGLPPPVAEGC